MEKAWFHEKAWSFEVLEDNGKQNPSESYTNKYEKHVTCSYGYKLVCI